MAERLSKDCLNPIALIPSSSVDKFRNTEPSYQWKPLQTILHIHQSVTRMPKDKTGIILGSGQNTSTWQSRGWLTLDIDPRYQSDFILDANHLEPVFKDTFDFVLAEYLNFNPSGKNGISPARLLNQANKILKSEGHLIVRTAQINGCVSSLPDICDYSKLMLRHGFQTVIEVGNYSGAIKNRREVTFYGKKIFNSFCEPPLTRSALV